jgi:lipid A 4'-phosphatase
MLRLPQAHIVLGFIVVLLYSISLDNAVMAHALRAPLWLQAIARPITWVGNSGWMAIVLVLTAIIAAFQSKQAKTEPVRGRAVLILRLAVIAVVAILASGIAVQLLNHILGWARPADFEVLDSLAFDPSLNSFASGHSTAIAVPAVFGIWFLPRKCFIWIAIAVVIAATRILTQHHFPSDTLAGLGLGAICALLCLRAAVQAGFIPQRRTLCYPWRARTAAAILRSPRPTRAAAAMPTDRVQLRLTVLLLACFIASLSLFLSLPWLDIWVSGLFWTPGTGFALAENGTLQLLRSAYLDLIYLMALVILFMLFGQLRLGQAMKTPHQIWSFMTASIIIGPGLVADWLFKGHWGRARPADIEVFGGSAQFTLPFEITDQCTRNCSFVSGEGSGISVIALLVGVLAWPHIRTRPLLWLGGIVVFASFGSGMRIATGRHFLSDTVFAALLMALVVLILYQVFQIGKYRQALHPAGLRADSRTVIAYLTGLTEPCLLQDLARILLACLGVLLACLGVLQVFGQLLGLLLRAMGNSAIPCIKWLGHYA